MSLSLKPLEDQVVVITGASSGIGLVTARMAAQRGARLVLAARSEAALRELADELSRDGHEALTVVADVSQEGGIDRVRDAAVDRFGGFDTWVNNAGVGMYGRIVDVPLDDMRSLYETNVFGLIRGTLAAAKHFKDRGDQTYAGSIINLGSVLSYQAIPLQGVYASSKHAVKGFTDSLRMELEHDGYPVNLALVMPNAIDTPYAKNAAQYTQRDVTLPPPVYAPETVARTILHAATHPTRDVTVGGAFKPVTALNKVVPGLVDTLMKTFMFDAQQKDEPAGVDRGGLNAASGSLQERSGEGRLTIPFSAYTQARTHPLVTTAVLAGVGLLAAGVLSRMNDDD